MHFKGLSQECYEIETSELDFDIDEGDKNNANA
jgi:hypothetical protein